MTNEYGADLDRNGYAPTIMQTAERCYMCGCSGVLARHEIYGAAYRDKSKQLGLWVNLCPECHHYIHFVDAGRKIELREHGQMRAERFYGWSKAEFRDRFGKSYL